MKNKKHTTHLSTNRKNHKTDPHQAHAQHKSNNILEPENNLAAQQPPNQHPPNHQNPPYQHEQNRPPQQDGRTPQNQRPPQQDGQNRPPHHQRPPQQDGGSRPPHHQNPPYQNRPPQSQRPPQQSRPPQPRPPVRPTPPPPTRPQPRPPHRPPNNTINFPSASIHKQRFERDFNFNNTTVLLLELENFIIETQNKRAEKRINTSLELQANNFVRTAITELYPLAVRDFLSAESNTYPFNPYASMLQYHITYNQNCHLSTYRDNYVFTGGAHGTTQRLASTYNLQNGNIVPLSTFFRRGTNYRRLLLAEIEKQATRNMQQNPNIYFDDYIELINSTFNEESFYLTKNGLVIYYGQYDIAPYVSGIIEFTIPYSILDNPPKCN